VRVRRLQCINRLLLLVWLEQMFVLLMVLFLHRMCVRMWVWVRQCVLLEW
jgi:hypothetical protein